MAIVQTRNNGYGEYATVHGFVHLAELPNLKTSYVPGSIVQVIEDGSRWVLDNGKKWCLLVKGAASGTNLRYVMVDELPSPSEALSNTVYMVKDEETGYYNLYMLSGDTFIQIGSTSSDFENIVTPADLEDYVKFENLDDGTIENIVVDGTITAPAFIEGEDALEDKYVQKKDLKNGTTQFDSIVANGVYVKEHFELDEDADMQVPNGNIDNLTSDKITADKVKANTVEGKILQATSKDGIKINNKNIRQYVEEIVGDKTVTKNELEEILPNILNTPVYQSDMAETDNSLPSYVRNKDLYLKSNTHWTGTKAEFEQVKDELPIGTYIHITDDQEEYLLEGSLIFKNAVNATTGLPTEGQNVGYLYIVDTDGTINQQECKIGDLWIVKTVNEETGEPTAWIYVPSGNDSQLGTLSVVSGELTRVGNGIVGDQTFGLATTGVTAGTYGEDDYTSAEETAGKKVLESGDTFKVVRATVDNKGRISNLKDIVLELPECIPNEGNDTNDDLDIRRGSIELRTKNNSDFSVSSTGGIYLEGAGTNSGIQLNTTGTGTATYNGNEIATQQYVDDAIAAITDFESEVFPNA